VRDAGLEAVDDLTRLAVALLFYTGQRIGDVCAMRWTAIKNEKIKVVQQKTGKSLMIRLHADLRAELDRYGKRGLTLLTNAQGGPVSPAQLRRILKVFCASLGHPELKPHGLRKNAVIALLTAGCSVAETAAITGQTYQLVEYYARQIDQERMGEAAILKMERAGNKQTAAQTSSGRGRKA
jgi:integrase